MGIYANYQQMLWLKLARCILHDSLCLQFINHENVNIQYDYLDKEGKSIKCKPKKDKKQKREEKLMAMLKQKLFLEDLKEDLEALEKEARAKIESQKLENGDQPTDQIEESKIDLGIITEEERLKVEELQKERRIQREAELKAELQQILQDKEGTKSQNKEQISSSDESIDSDQQDWAENYSSGLDSDNDVDLLVEQEVLQVLNFRKQQQILEQQRQLNSQTTQVQSQIDTSSNFLPQTLQTSKLQQNTVSKEENEEITEVSQEKAFKTWQLVTSQVPKPDQYDFIIRTYNEGFPKGSQVFLCYGRMSNREMLKRYGFCLQWNKYNYAFIKLLQL